MPTSGVPVLVDLSSASPSGMASRGNNATLMDVTEALDQEFEALLDYLKRSRGFDFTGYKRASLTRRVQKRMQSIGITGFGEYLDYLEVYPEEFSALFNVILINVTSFFRDTHVWEYMAGEILPHIIGNKLVVEPIRVWSAGCASGEEAYTVAMILAETLGLEQFRARVKIYATDVDDEALSYARLASYSEKEVAGVPPEMLEKYFEKSGRRFVFHKDLRHSIIFGRHDLSHDAPISRIDLLICRNALMYFNVEAQSKILNRFHFALSDGGYLFLGKAEMLLTHTYLFSPVDLKRRVFTKVPKGGGPVRRINMVNSPNERGVMAPPDYSRIRALALSSDPQPQIVVDLNGYIVVMSNPVRQLFNLNESDLGRPIQDLEISYRPVELRSRIDQVRAERRAITLKDVEWRVAGETRWLEVHITPLIAEDHTLLAVKVAFLDVSPYKQLQQELQQSNQELETAYEELQSTNEELVTTNEELQSTNEELETTNEELQSTNEELETINEELQSASEELETINDDLRERTAQLDHSNIFLEAILSSLRGGVVVVDQDLNIQIWNNRAEDLWGLRGDEVRGKSLLNLDIGLPLDQLRQIIRGCLNGEAHEVTLAAINRRGKTIRCDVACTPLIGTGAEINGVILLMEEKE